MALPPTFPELAALDLFHSVVQLGSLSRAAAEHQITQPSASSRIRHLERQLSMQLLDRSPTGSRPTPEGAVVAGWVKSLLTSADELRAGVDALNAERTGHLRLAASFTIAEYLLPQLLEKFLRHRSEDSVSLDVINSAAVIDRLGKGTVDLGFIESPIDTVMNEQTIATDELIVVTSPQHPWSKRSSIPLEAILTTPLVLREAGSGTRETFAHHLEEMGFDAPMAALELGSTSAVRAAVTTGVHPTVISRLAVDADLAAGTLVEIRIPGLEITRRLRAVWPKRAPLPLLAEALLHRLPDLD